MTELEKYQRVANSETIEELLEVVESFAVGGMIQGRTKKFPVEDMIRGMRQYYLTSNLVQPNVATREYGIRGKMMELTYYKN